MQSHLSELRPALEVSFLQFEDHVFDTGFPKGLFNQGFDAFVQVTVEADHMRDRIAQGIRTSFKDFPHTTHKRIFEEPLICDQRVAGRERKFCPLVDEIGCAALFQLDAVAIDRNVEIEPANAA